MTKRNTKLKQAMRFKQQWSNREQLSRYVYDSSGQIVGHVSKGVFTSARATLLAIVVPGGDYRAKWPQMTREDHFNMIRILRKTRMRSGTIACPRLP